MNKSKFIRADPAFVDFVDDLGEEIANDLGWDKNKVSRSMVTRYIVKKYKKKKGIVI